MTGATLERARAAKVILAAMLADAVEVCGIGIAVVADGYGVKVNVTDVAAAAVLHIPADVGGVPVIVAVSGQIRPL